MACWRDSCIHTPRQTFLLAHQLPLTDILCEIISSFFFFFSFSGVFSGVLLTYSAFLAFLAFFLVCFFAFLRYQFLCCGNLWEGPGLWSVKLRSI